MTPKLKKKKVKEIKRSKKRKQQLESETAGLFSRQVINKYHTLGGLNGRDLRVLKTTLLKWSIASLLDLSSCASSRSLFFSACSTVSLCSDFLFQRYSHIRICPNGLVLISSFKTLSLRASCSEKLGVRTLT